MKPKLVRDKIPDIIKSDGKNPKTRIASDSEYWMELKNKLLEEVNEFLEDDDPEELADINEVLKAIYEYKGLTAEEIETLRKQKEENRGGFKKRIILENIE